MQRSTLFAVVPAVLVLGTAAMPVLAQKAEKAPSVVGDWTGTWTVYNPAQAEKMPPNAKPAALPKLKLDCKVTPSGEGKWQAVFSGEAGGPYKYTIKMMGRQAGTCVLFQGTADLGPKDGGVYDWIGRATDKEFIGFYTSQGYTGTFQMARAAATEPK
jgi:hypothetical protein